MDESMDGLVKRMGDLAVEQYGSPAANGLLDAGVAIINLRRKLRSALQVAAIMAFGLGMLAGLDGAELISRGHNMQALLLIGVGLAMFAMGVRYNIAGLGA